MTSSFKTIFWHNSIKIKRLKKSECKNDSSKVPLATQKYSIYWIQIHFCVRLIKNVLNIFEHFQILIENTLLNKICNSLI